MNSFVKLSGLIKNFEFKPSLERVCIILLGIVAYCLNFLTPLPTYGQADSVNSITRQFIKVTSQKLPEKLFLHLDRPVYVAGETMWFKIYAVDGTYHKALSLSKVAYVEVLDRDNKPVLQGKIALKQAVGQGSFVLPVTLASGNYVVRGYTSWMKNNDPDFFFHCPVTIVNTFTNLGLKPTKDTVAYDIQFFPEGGNLVQGLRSTVGFKVTDINGQGIDAEGTIFDLLGKPLTQFKTARFGMGRFDFIPSETATYQALITLPGKKEVKVSLPAVYKNGFVMSLTEIATDKIKVSVETNTAEALADEVFLLGHARQKVAVSAQARLQNGRVEFIIDKNRLAAGVTHFTLFNSQNKPLCERLYFIRPQKTLTINAATDKLAYTTRDKITISYSANNYNRKAVPAQLSMAVYRMDSLPSLPVPDINSYLWLTSDLKGNIQHPEYYFSGNSAEVAEATDNLMLTQGWRRFKWESIFAEPAGAFEFLPEINGHLIRGMVTNKVKGKPTAGITTYLASPSRHIRMYNAVSKENGLLQFNVQNFYGPREIILQSNTSLDSTAYLFQVFNPFSVKHASLKFKPLNFSEQHRADLTQRHLQIQLQNAYFKQQSNLFLPAFTDSMAFYGKPDETYLLDDFTRFKVMEEVMREYVPGVQVRIRKDGFHFMVFDRVNKAIFQDNPMVLLDGVPVFNVNKMMAVDPLKIQKLDVITSRYLHGSLIYNGLVSYTTYKGDLEGYQLDPRTFVQEYEGLQHQREFYAPRYSTAIEKQSRLPDFRNLLYWNPNVRSSANTNQPLEFYTSDKAGKYLVVIQGLSPDGLAGSTSFSFEVKQPL